MYRLLVGLTLLTLTACPVAYGELAQSTQVTTLALEPSAPLTVIPTVSITPMPEPTLQLLATRSYVPAGPTPALPASFNYREFLFADNPCALPCWQGLVPGEAEPADVQRVIDGIMGLNETINFFEPGPYLHPGALIVIPNYAAPEDHYLIGYAWFPNDVSGLYYAGVFNEADVLMGLSFDFNNLPSDSTPTLEMFLNELGRPDYWTISWTRPTSLSPREDERDMWVDTYLIWTEGIHVRLGVVGPLSLQTEGIDQERVIYTLCEQGRSHFADVFLTTSYDDLAKLAPHQLFPVLNADFFTNASHVEDAFGMDKDTLMDYLLSNEDACLNSG
jgi:hypothetical protein